MGQCLISCFLLLKYPGIFPIQYAGIMLYAFQPLLCLTLSRHNQCKPTSKHLITYTTAAVAVLLAV